MHHFFCTFLCRLCTTATWKCVNSRFVEGGNTRQPLSFSFPELWYSATEFNSKKNCQRLTNQTGWNKRDKVWSSVNSLFRWRFRFRLRRRCCLSSLVSLPRWWSVIGQTETCRTFFKTSSYQIFFSGKRQKFRWMYKKEGFGVFYLLIFFFWKNSAGPFKCIIALHFSLVSSIRLWSVALAKSYLAIRSCLISIHVKFLFHFIGISRACRRAWDTGHCWTWSKSLIGSQNTKWSENMSLKREFVYDTIQLPWHG